MVKRTKTTSVKADKHSKQALQELRKLAQGSQTVFDSDSFAKKLQEWHARMNPNGKDS